MEAWDKGEAIKALERFIEEVESLRHSSPFSAEHTRWVANVHRILEQVFGTRSRYYLTFAQLRWRFRGTTILTADELLAGHPDDAMRGRDQDAYWGDLQTAVGLLQAAADELTTTERMADVYHGRDTPPEASSVLKVINIVERKLRKVIRSRPANEKEVQDAFETLLIGADVPYAREKVTFDYSSRSYRPDFTLDMIGLAIEIKLCAKEGRESKIVSEINDDILGYRTRYRNLVFVVYDLGLIRDVDRFASEFESHDDVFVRVVKH